ncbi:glycosyltransferase family 2 protein [Halioxenophilus sp. WMMB6]|uniref:glycosyltransferase family 2 protein n=1 Tax=Halioxenophilus sp. WMMB6 TaxID=3073815 RepID=UPI00295E7515|nr:glycosyltransferase family 2 protein [Halioxenophilus sp. WMMB6]
MTCNSDPTIAASLLAGHSLSVVIPFYNEQGNCLALLEELQQALTNLPCPWEVICVNDGSRDGTQAELNQARQQLGGHVVLIQFSRNFGQSAAMQAGIDNARGDIIVTLDGDRQNDPADIPAIITELIGKDLDMVAGWRKNRQDSELDRKLPSRIANLLIRKVTGIDIKDNGCSLKAFRASVIKQITLMGEMHRFIPAWVSGVTDPSRIGELAVNHRARTTGQSKYGLSRTYRVILDLIVVRFFMRFARRPGHFFGGIGMLSGSIGALMLFYLLALKLFTGADIGGRPLLFTGILLVITSIQLITTGILSELQARNKPVHYPTRSATANGDRTWSQHEQ